MKYIRRIDEFTTYGTDAQWEYGMGVEDWNEKPKKDLMQYTEEEFLEYATRVASWFFYIDRGGYVRGQRLSKKDMDVINGMIEYIKIHGVKADTGDIYFPENEETAKVFVTYESAGYFMIESYKDTNCRNIIKDQCLYISIENNNTMIYK